jgi:hypothetical protein
MAQYKHNGFKNNPSVSSEYIKFLIMNMGMDVIDKMEKKQTTLEDKVTNSSSPNGIRTVKSAVDALSKRVNSIEGKK